MFSANHSTVQHQNKNNNNSKQSETKNTEKNESRIQIVVSKIQNACNNEQALIPENI